MENKLNIVVSNRSRSEAFRPPSNEKWAVISIFSPDNLPAELHGFTRTLQLGFDDVCSADLGLSLFTPQMANEVLMFVDEIIDENILNLLVHCDGGQSRSPGVAVALDEIVNASTERAAKHPHYNTLVYHTIVNEDQRLKDTGFTFIKDHFG